MQTNGHERIVQRARMRMLFRQAVSRIDSAAQAEGLSPAQYHVLLALAARAGEAGLAETQLVQYLDASRAHVSVLVRSLETSGLVRDWRDADDRRQVRLAVTDAGWELLERLGDRQEEVLREFVEGIDAAEIQGIVSEISTRYLGLTQRA
ncbi:MAG TPA: MarR family transcriptional regulator [Candidatus Dormibacteraeota bacterium]|jgi:DNA-binding MarR family transcriptional regulator|nr:MarR family transcriptional regulator [Candidatus Dormibacteraeota bacterium]